MAAASGPPEAQDPAYSPARPPAVLWISREGKKDTVNAALREVSERLVRLRALEHLGEMADRGDFDEFIADKTAYRR